MGKKKGTLTSSEGGGSPSYEENEAVANSANATIQDVLAAIRTLSENVDKRFIELNTTITSLKADVSDINARVTTTEEATVSHEKRIEDLERLCTSLASQCKQQQAKLSYMEDCARRQNIRIVGIKEKAENGKWTDFVSTLLPTLLGEEHFSVPIRIDNAFRSSKIRMDRKPRPITVRFHHLAVKELVMKLAKDSSGLRYDNSPVLIYPDLPADILQKRQQFTAINCMAVNSR